MRHQRPQLVALQRFSSSLCYLSLYAGPRLPPVLHMFPNDTNCPAFCPAAFLLSTLLPSPPCAQVPASPQYFTYNYNDINGATRLAYLSPCPGAGASPAPANNSPSPPPRTVFPPPAPRSPAPAATTDAQLLLNMKVCGGALHWVKQMLRLVSPSTDHGTKFFLSATGCFLEANFLHCRVSGWHVR